MEKVFRRGRIWTALAAAMLMALPVGYAPAEGGTVAAIPVTETGAEASQASAPVIVAGYVPEGRETVDFDGDEGAIEVFEDGYVFGEDERQLIYDTAQYPYSAIAYMEAEYKCGCSSTGTGFLVSNNKLMTAAHCVVCSEHREWADRIDFYFGYRDDWHYEYHYDGRWYAFVGSTFPDGYSTKDDWAVVKLYDDVGNTTGWFGFMYNMADRDITAKLLRLAGYRNGTLKTDSGYADTGSQNLLKYKMDMEPGNSGAPVYFLDGDTPYAAAINIAENPKTNYGYRITDTIYRYYEELDGY